MASGKRTNYVGRKRLNSAGDEIRRQEAKALENAKAAAAKLELESNVPETEVKPA